MNLKITVPLLLSSVLALAACSESSNFNFENNIAEAANSAPTVFLLRSLCRPGSMCLRAQ